jgi:hypothetical protein
VPGGYVANEVPHIPCRVNNAGASATGLAVVGGGGTVLGFFRDLTGTANWSSASNSTSVIVVITFEIQQLTRQRTRRQRR